MNLQNKFSDAATVEHCQNEVSKPLSSKLPVWPLYIQVTGKQLRNTVKNDKLKPPSYLCQSCFLSCLMALKASEQAPIFDAGFLAKSMLNLDKKPEVKYNACWVVSRSNKLSILLSSRYNQAYAYWLLKTILRCAIVLELIFSFVSDINTRNV